MQQRAAAAAFIHSVPLTELRSSITELAGLKHEIKSNYTAIYTFCKYIKNVSIERRVNTPITAEILMFTGSLRLPYVYWYINHHYYVNLQ